MGAPTVRLGDDANDRETEARSVLVVRHAAIPRERLERAVKRLGRVRPGPVSWTTKRTAPSSRSPDTWMPSAPRRVSHRVVQEVVDRLAETRGVHVGKGRRRLHRDRHARGPGAGLVPLGDAPQQLPQIGRLAAHGETPVVRSGEHQKVFGQPHEVVRLLGGAPERGLSSSALRGRASARSSSAFKIESGVRSSWLASSTNRSSRSTEAWIRSSMRSSWRRAA